MRRACAFLLALVGATALACGAGSSVLVIGPIDAGDSSTMDSGLPDVADNADEGGTPTSGDSGATEAAPDIGLAPAPPTTALLRFANWSPDAPTIDMCVAPHGTAAFQGPIMARLAAMYENDAGTGSEAGVPGLASPWVSAYMLMAPAQYDARIVVAGSGSCAVGIGQDATQLPYLQAGGAETIGIVEQAASVPTGYKMRIIGFPDDVSPTGVTAIRVINAVTAMPQIDVGTGSLANNTFLAIFQHVPIDMTGQSNGAWIPFLVDANGYYANAAIPSMLLSAHATGATSDAVTASNPTAISPGSVVTIAVVGRAAGAGTALVECFDNAGTIGTLADCIVSM